MMEVIIHRCPHLRSAMSLAALQEIDANMQSI